MYPLSYATDIAQDYIPLSHPQYIHHTKYMQKVDVPMIYVMVESEADIRELIIMHKRINCHVKVSLLTRNLEYLVCFAILDH